MTDMIQAQRDLEKDMRTLSISRFYRLHENAEKRGGSDETFIGREYSFISNERFLIGLMRSSDCHPMSSPRSQDKLIRS